MYGQQYNNYYDKEFINHTINQIKVIN